MRKEREKIEKISKIFHSNPLHSNSIGKITRGKIFYDKRRNNKK